MSDCIPYEQIISTTSNQPSQCLVHPSLWKDYRLTSFGVYDVRYPTSVGSHGSDAVHVDPDYSAAYLLLHFDYCGKKSNINSSNVPRRITGHGMTFCLGKGNEVIIKCIESQFEFIKNLSFFDITNNILEFSRKLSCHPQFRWLGPEKGVIHLSCCAYMNAIFDLWSFIYNKPFWKFISDMSAKEMSKIIDLQYITDILNHDELIKTLELKFSQNKKLKQIKWLFKNGYPLYTTAAGWLGYSDDQVRKLCRKYLSEGFNAFKMKVGKELSDDMRRARIIRSEIGENRKLMTDSNQKWDVNEAISWMTNMKKYNIYWIEEPTHADDILGHLAIKKGLQKRNTGIGVASGEHCHNKTMFKQFIQCGALDFLQLDTGRLNGAPEWLSVLCMADKYNIPVCPHAGGVGLNEMVRHWIMIDFICISQTVDGRMCEYAQHLDEHFIEGALHKNGRYYPPMYPGYCRMKWSSIKDYQFPNGKIWKEKLQKKEKADAPLPTLSKL